MWVVLLLNGCNASTESSSHSVHAVIRGDVIDGGGSPVEGATVYVLTKMDVPGPDSALLDEETEVTNAAGAYLFAETLAAVAEPGEAGAFITVTPPAGSRLAPRTITGVVVQYSLVEPPPETTVVAIVLEASGAGFLAAANEVASRRIACKHLLAAPRQKRQGIRQGGGGSNRPSRGFPIAQQRHRW